MKTTSTIAGAGRSRRHAFTATLAAFASLATLGSAATFNSPVGTWDCTMSGGGQEGISVIEFYDYGTNNGGTFYGYQLLSTTPKKAKASARSPGERNPGVEGRGWGTSGTDSATGSTNLFGMLVISGPWEYDASGRVIGHFVEVVKNYADPSSPITNSVSFSAKVVPGKRLTMASSTPNGKVSYRGVPFTELSDISGNWQGVKKQDKQSFVEFFTLTNYPGFPNLYKMYGTGPGYYYRDGVVNFVTYITNFGFSEVPNTNTGGTDYFTNSIITTNTFTQTNYTWCLLSAQKKIGFSLTEVRGSNGTARASFGNFKSSKQKTSAKTKGTLAPDTAISFDADRNAGQAVIPPVTPPVVVTNQP